MTNQERATALFETHPQVNLFNFTSDGLAFEKAHDAQAHARTLTDKKIESINRDGSLTEVEEQTASDEAIETANAALNEQLDTANDITKKGAKKK